VIKFIIIGLCLPFSIYPSCFFLSACASFSLSALRYLCLAFSVCSSVFRSACPLSFCLSIHLPVCPFFRLAACLSVHMTVSLSAISIYKINFKKKSFFLFSQNEGIGHISNTDLCGFMQTDRRTDRQTGAN
jgi:hypothetical protein